MSVEWNDDAIIAKVRAAAMRGVVRGTEAVVEEATSLILETAKTGRVYQKTRPRRTHQASAPGEAPASDRGNLVRSARTAYDQQEISGTANWSTAYAGFLEFGTQKMEPRPFARPALANRIEEIQADIQTEIAKALK